jgi:ubiquitin-protein ligase
MSSRFTKRIMKELAILRANSLDNPERDPNGTPLKFTVKPNDSDINIVEITVSIDNFYDPDKSAKEQQLIYKQLKEANIKFINFEVRFNEYPLKPPFVRVIEPVLTGGNVMEGGNICIDLFGTKLWAPTITIVNVMVMVVQLLRDNKLLKLDNSGKLKYSYENAVNNDKTFVKRVHSDWNYREDLK